MSWYPINIELADQPCVVVGGGEIAARKAAGLMAAGGRVTVVSPELAPSLAELVDAGEVKWVARPYESGDLDSYFLAITATDDAAVNRQVYLDGEASGILVNSADDPQNCRFILPALIRRGDLVITATTSGRSPAMAVHLRRRLAHEFGDEWGVLVELLGEARDAIRSTGRSTEGMADKWEAAISADVLALIRAGEIDEARERVSRCLS